MVLAVFYMKGTSQSSNSDEYVNILRSKYRLGQNPISAKFYKNNLYLEAKEKSSIDLDLQKSLAP
jgi:hypothetical protein